MQEQMSSMNDSGDLLTWNQITVGDCLTFPVNQQRFQVLVRCWAATNACLLIHGIQRDSRKTFLKTIPRSTLKSSLIFYQGTHPFMTPSTAGEAHAFISTSAPVSMNRTPSHIACADTNTLSAHQTWWKTLTHGSSCLSCAWNNFFILSLVARRVVWPAQHAYIDDLNSAFIHLTHSSSLTDCGRNEVLVSAGGNAEAMEPNAYHKAEYCDDDDSTSTVVHGDSFIGVEDWRVPRRESNGGAQSGHRSVDSHWNWGQDLEVSPKLETSWYHSGQIGADRSSVWSSRREHSPGETIVCRRFRFLPPIVGSYLFCSRRHASNGLFRELATMSFAS